MYSSDDIHLDFFHLLAIVNSATINMECRCLLDILILIPLDMCPEVG